MFTFLLYCRVGFEQEAGLELEQILCTHEVPFFWRTPKDAKGYMLVDVPQEQASFFDGLREDLIFCRQIVRVLCICDQLPKTQKVEAIFSSLRSVLASDLEWSVSTQEDFKMSPQIFQNLWVEALEHSTPVEGLANFCKTFFSPMAKFIRKEGLLPSLSTQEQKSYGGNWQNLVIAFTSYSSCYVCVACSDLSSQFSQGIPRLKALPDCPSRSGLKLQEALLTLLPPPVATKSFSSVCSAVDLGASPGGWTQVLLSKGLHVWAIDNGPMALGLGPKERLKHMRADGFTWIPPRVECPVDWLVCDMVDKPHKVCDLVVKWFKNKYAKKALFNLKLPMKNRYPEVLKCLGFLKEHLGDLYEIKCKHLYHDREEITVVCLPLSDL